MLLRLRLPIELHRYCSLRAPISAGSFVLAPSNSKQVFRGRVVLILLGQDIATVEAVREVIGLDLLHLAELAGDVSTCSPILEVVDLIVSRLYRLMCNSDLPSRVVVWSPLLVVDIGRLGDLFAQDQLLDQF